MLKNRANTNARTNGTSDAVGWLGLCLLMLQSGCGGNDASTAVATGQEAQLQPATASAPASRPSPVQAAPIAAPEIPTDAPVLAERYPTLSSGALRHARLTSLPEGIVLRAEGVSITQQDIEREVEQAPSHVREPLRQNAFFLLEQQATGEILLTRARQTISAKQIDDGLLIERYIESVIGSVTVSDEEILAFYEENRHLVGGASLNQVRTAIEQNLVQQRQQDAIQTLITDLGRTTPIAVSAEWAEQQSALALDNPLDRARASGIPTFASFGADSCMPCQMMKPFREAIEKKYGEHLNVVYVQVNEQQILSSRYGVRGIPHIMFFDAEGREVHARTGFMEQEQIEEWIGKIGVTM